MAVILRIKLYFTKLLWKYFVKLIELLLIILLFTHSAIFLIINSTAIIIFSIMKWNNLYDLRCKKKSIYNKRNQRRVLKTRLSFWRIRLKWKRALKSLPLRDKIPACLPAVYLREACLRMHSGRQAGGEFDPASGGRILELNKCGNLSRS